MRLQPEGAPDAAHGGGTDASALRHLAGAPVGPPLRLTFQRGDEDRLDIRIGQCPGAPGLGSSYSASTRPVVNRCRHLPTVTFEQRSFAATATFDSPCAHLRTIFARKATCRFVLARLASRSSSPRSTAVTSNLALGRPVLAMPPNTSHPAHFLKRFQTHGTRGGRTGAVGNCSSPPTVMVPVIVAVLPSAAISASTEAPVWVNM